MGCIWNIVVILSLFVICFMVVTAEPAEFAMNDAYTVQLTNYINDKSSTVKNMHIYAMNIFFKLIISSQNSH